MERILYVNEGFCAAAEDGRLVEYIPEDPGETAGEILLGRVERLMPGMNAAFVEIGQKRAGFLPMTEGSRSFAGGGFRSGDSVIVQVKKEAYGEKGAFLTRDVSLAGKTVLLMPMNRYIGVSRRVEAEDERARLKTLGQAIAGTDFGLIMRAAAADAEEAEIRKEAASLREEWNTVLREAGGEAVRTLKARQSAAEEMIRDYSARGGVARVIRGEALSADLERQLRSAGLRRVTLPHGGNIVIDRCEAMTVIDVNTAGNTAGQRPEGIFTETNLEACDEIARQVRLRNLSGVLIIDFINLQAETDRDRISERLNKGFENDRVKTVIHGFTSLGLMEMTRKRSRPDWYEQQTEVCAACGGTGRIRKSTSSPALQAEGKEI